MTASAFPLFPNGTIPASLWLNGEFVPWNDATVHVTAMGAGAHGYSLFVDADDLLAAYGATVADISQPATPR